MDKLFSNDKKEFRKLVKQFYSTSIGKDFLFLIVVIIAIELFSVMYLNSSYEFEINDMMVIAFLIIIVAAAVLRAVYYYLLVQYSKTLKDKKN